MSKLRYKHVFVCKECHKNGYGAPCKLSVNDENTDDAIMVPTICPYADKTPHVIPDWKRKRVIDRMESC